MEREMNVERKKRALSAVWTPVLSTFSLRLVVRFFSADGVAVIIVHTGFVADDKEPICCRSNG